MLIFSSTDVHPHFLTRHCFTRYLSVFSLHRASRHIFSLFANNNSFKMYNLDPSFFFAPLVNPTSRAIPQCLERWQTHVPQKTNRGELAYLAASLFSYLFYHQNFLNSSFFSPSFFSSSLLYPLHSFQLFLSCVFLLFSLLLFFIPFFFCTFNTPPLLTISSCFIYRLYRWLCNNAAFQIISYEYIWKRIDAVYIFRYLVCRTSVQVWENRVAQHKQNLPLWLTL